MIHCVKRPSCSILVQSFIKNNCTFFLQSKDNDRRETGFQYDPFYNKG